MRVAPQKPISVGAAVLLQLQDFGTSLWQLQGHATSLPSHLKGGMVTAQFGLAWPSIRSANNAAMESK
jgi:hypothetical protein